MANTKISALTANTNPSGLEEFVYAYNNANGKITLNTMKAFVGGTGITTLNTDANIWTLSDGIYETTHELYYKSGSAVPHATGGVMDLKQMIFVVDSGIGQKGYFTFNESTIGTNTYSRASYGYSNSSSSGVCNQLADKDYPFTQYGPATTSTYINRFDEYGITQIVSQISGQQELAIQGDPYPGVTYTVYVDSVQSEYTVSVGTGITNPLNITLPTSSNKKCVITVLMTSTTTGIVTGCTIEN